MTTPHEGQALATAQVTLESALGPIRVTASAHGVVRVELGGGCHPDRGKGPALALARRARRELMGYLAGRRRTFGVPVDVEGTDFQEAVWQALDAIPYGKTASYGEIARRIGKPAASRAIGGACNKNPVPLIVPCHRVVAAGGLGGFGYGEKAKRWLLELERS